MNVSRFLDCHLVGVVLVLFGAWTSAAAGPDQSEEYQYNCGILSLYTLLQLENARIDLADLESRLPPPSPDGCSLKELRDAARAVGVELRGVRLSDAPGSLDRPALVFIDAGGHGHYIVIRPCGRTGKLLQILDANHSPRVIDESFFKSSESWTGIALIPTRTNTRLLSLVVIVLVASLLVIVKIRLMSGRILSRGVISPSTVTSAGVG